MIIGVTGHRPQHLGGYTIDASERRRAFAIATLDLFQPDSVITGMAQGWDTAIAQACLELRIPYSAYIPGLWQADAWPDRAQHAWRNLLDDAAEVKCFSEGGYYPIAMQIRNMAIVDDCDMLLALWNGSPGGTANCVDYATRGRAVPRETVNLWHAWESFR